MEAFGLKRLWFGKRICWTFDCFWKSRQRSLRKEALRMVPAVDGRPTRVVVVGKTCMELGLEGMEVERRCEVFGLDEEVGKRCD